MKAIKVTVIALGVAIGGVQLSFAQGEASISKMHQTMQQIRETEDPERRAELLEQHLDEMHAVMGRMHRELGELMQGVEEQKRETRRVHDHRRTRTPASRR